MLTLFPEWYKVQAEWSVGFMEGHPDLLSDFLDEREGKWHEYVIVDLKYVTAKTVDQTVFSYFDWSDPHNNDPDN